MKGTAKTLVYRFGAKRPRSAEEEALAVQALGQAWLYKDDLRRVYNADKRALRARLAGLAEAEHVRSYDAERCRVDELAHVLAYERVSTAGERRLPLNEAIRAARAKRGHLLDAGTYWRVEDAVLQASKALGTKDLKSEPFDGTGTLGAMIQSTEKFPAASFHHKRVTLEIVRTRPNGKRDAELTLTIGDLKSQRRIRFPVVLHRDFPEGAIVDRVGVQRTRTGHYFSWEVLVTLTFAASEGRLSDASAKGIVGIDVGWRNDGPKLLRVATHDGLREGVIDAGALHVDTVEALAYVDAVRSTRDRVFDAAKGYAADAGIPGAENAKLWRDKSRLLRLAQKTQEFGISWWRLRDRHLEEIESGVRARAIRRRLDAMRVYVDRLAKRYEIFALEDMPMVVWTGTLDATSLERHRSAAAISILHRMLLDRVGSSRIDWVPPAYSTMTCADCGVVRDEPVGPSLSFACEGCGKTHHQDENAARVLRLRCERWIGDGNPVRARTKRKAGKREGKAEKKGDARKNRRTKEETAREPAAEAAE